MMIFIKAARFNIYTKNYPELYTFTSLEVLQIAYQANELFNLLV